MSLYIYVMLGLFGLGALMCLDGLLLIVVSIITLLAAPFTRRE